MRKFTVFGGLLASLVAFVAIAQAATVQTVKMTVSPSKAGTKAAPKGVAINVTTTTTDSAGPLVQPPTTRLATLTFGKELDLLTNKGKFPTCTATRASAMAACPAGSKVGSGKAKGLALKQVADLTVTAANGTGNKFLLGVRGTKPIVIDNVITATLTRGPGGTTKLNVPIPASLQQPVPNVFAALTLFQTRVQKTIRAGGKTFNYVNLIGCGSSRKITVTGKFNYTNGTSKTAKNTAPCSK